MHVADPHARGSPGSRAPMPVSGGGRRGRCYAAVGSSGGRTLQVLGSRRGGLITLTIAAVALVVVAAFAVWQLVERPSVDPITPAPGASVSDQKPTITVAVPGDARLGGLKVTVDGHDATADARSEDGRLAIVAPQKLAEGTHSVSVTSAAATSSRARSAGAGSSRSTRRRRSWR